MSIQIDTAFVIARRPNGTYFATTNLDTNFEVDHTASSLEVKHGCLEILSVLTNQELANTIVAKLAESSQSETEKATSSIRQALTEKGIL